MSADRGPHGEDDTDALFQSIVDNYGERATLPDAEPGPPTDRAGDQAGDRAGDPRPGRPPSDEPVVSPGLFRLAGEPEPQPRVEHEDHFVPPEPPPVAWPEPRRGLAWVALFGSPTVLLLALVLRVALPSWVTTLLGVGFVGGFVFLVATMGREPGDGWDDGARL